MIHHCGLCWARVRAATGAQHLTRTIGDSPHPNERRYSAVGRAMFKLGCRRAPQLFGAECPSSALTKMYRPRLSPLILQTAHPLGHTLPLTRHCRPPTSRHFPAAAFFTTVRGSAEQRTTGQHNSGSKAADDEILFTPLDPGTEPLDHEPSLPDVTEADLEGISKGIYGVEYLSEAPSSQQLSYPPEGIVSGSCRRMFINLVCVRRPFEGEASPPPPINVVFVVDTTSVVSYLSRRALAALAGVDEGSDEVPFGLMVSIDGHCRHGAFEYYQSFGTFAHINVLGMWALHTLEWTPIIDWKHEDFILTPYDPQSQESGGEGGPSYWLTEPDLLRGVWV
mmetsp:Transcript_17271/g.49039  ORF Transcript_17271/g.49039 Transcript_17271/m.49039 type:complete len:337 (-) Transcript_17271:309-1319(-)